MPLPDKNEIKSKPNQQPNRQDKGQCSKESKCNIIWNKSLFILSHNIHMHIDNYDSSVVLPVPGFICT